MSIIVTGAAGFIGANNVLALNRRGITDVIAVDNLSRAENLRIWSSAKFPITLISVTLSNWFALAKLPNRKPSSTKEPAPTRWKQTAAT